MSVTVDKLGKALQKRLKIAHDEAGQISQRVMNYFGFENFIVDNALDQPDRQLFYRLHDAGLLRTSWETILLLSGKHWRIFYWELNESDLDRVLTEVEELGSEPLYNSLPDEYWGKPEATHTHT